MTNLSRTPRPSLGLTIVRLARSTSAWTWWVSILGYCAESTPILATWSSSAASLSSGLTTPLSNRYLNPPSPHLHSHSPASAQKSRGHCCTCTHQQLAQTHGSLAQAPLSLPITANCATHLTRTCPKLPWLFPLCHSSAPLSWMFM